MNILYITDNNIMGHGGGCLGARKYYSAIKAYAAKENASFRVISLGQNMPEAILLHTCPITIHCMHSGICRLFQEFQQDVS